MRLKNFALFSLFATLVQVSLGCSDDGSSDSSRGASDEEQGADDAGSKTDDESNEETNSGDDTATPGSTNALSFLADGTKVDFAGANNASYYKLDSNRWRAVIVLNDLEGDKYIGLDLVATGSNMLEPTTYDCSQRVDEDHSARVKITYRNGTDEWAQAEGLPCSVTLESIGEVGGRIVGSFAATLAAKVAPESTLEITAGSFDVKRN